jgi:hypothetical protein
MQEHILFIFLIITVTLQSAVSVQVEHLNNNYAKAALLRQNMNNCLIFVFSWYFLSGPPVRSFHQ